MDNFMGSFGNFASKLRNCALNGCHLWLYERDGYGITFYDFVVFYDSKHDRVIYNYMDCNYMMRTETFMTWVALVPKMSEWKVVDLRGNVVDKWLKM